MTFKSMDNSPVYLYEPKEREEQEVKEGLISLEKKSCLYVCIFPK